MEMRNRATGAAGGGERQRRPLPQGWKPETDPYTEPPANLQVSLSNRLTISASARAHHSTRVKGVIAW